MTSTALPLLFVLAFTLLCSCAMQPSGRAAGPRLAHDVFFTLHENTPANRDRLVAGCYELLATLPGIVFFAAGTRVPDLQRDVNDQGYDVSLHVYFESRAAHDAYQKAEAHLQFIAEHKAEWKAVRVFDSDLPMR